MYKKTEYKYTVKINKKVVLIVESIINLRGWRGLIADEFKKCFFPQSRFYLIHIYKE